MEKIPLTGMTKSRWYGALRYKEFRLYSGMRFCFTFANQMQTTVIGFYVYQLTHSKIALAFIGLSEVIPALGLALYGGYITDRYEKRKMLSGSLMLVFCTSLILCQANIDSDHAGHHIPVIMGILYAMLFLNGIARAFYEPVIFSIYAQSLPRDCYANGAGWNNISWQSASILAPVLGGVLYAFGHRVIPGLSGLSAAFIPILLLYLISFWLVKKMRRYPPSLGHDKGEKKAEKMLAGLRFVFKKKMMLYTISLDLFSVLFGGVSALLPVYALDILHVGAAEVGLLRMAMSAGAALTMLVMVRFSPEASPWRNLLIAVAGYGLSILAFGLSQSFLWSMIFLFLQGAFDSVSVMIRGLLLQLFTPDHMRGRVSAVNSMFIGSSAEIGDFESGIVARLLGTVPAVLFGGCMTLAIVTITFLKTRPLCRLSLSQLEADEEVKYLIDSEEELDSPEEEADCEIL